MVRTLRRFLQLFAFSTMTGATANPGCPCTNATATLASTPGRQCQLPSGEKGIQLTVGGSCVPYTYGSYNCRQHDLIHDPSCTVDNPGDDLVPAYCFRPWCYVDKYNCKKNSEERAIRSSYFPHDSGIDLFYSYTTCNATSSDWFDAVGEIDSVAVGGIGLEVNVPTYQLPLMYKRDPVTKESLSSPGIEFFDDSVPYEGVYPSYVNRIAEISKGDIKNITYTHRSRSGSISHPSSSFTAAVQDIEDGLVDMSVGPFWITAQRLKMAAFTIPLVYDNTYLVIPRPGTQDNLRDQVSKVLEPFEIDLWVMLLGMIALAALLSVVFTDQGPSVANKTQSRDRRSAMQSGGGFSGVNSMRRNKVAYCRLYLDSVLEKGLFFCGAGVEQDQAASLPHKILMFGFGFLILITVSAYVANLAAFLTKSTTEGVKSMEAAVAADLWICAHPAVSAELEVAWPDANFYFHKEGNEFPGILDDYLAGECQVMAVGWEDTSMDSNFTQRLCNNDLVFTDWIVAEIPIAFPTRLELASGFSYWMIEGERKHGLTLQSAKDEYAQEKRCDFVLDGITESNDFTQISVKNMFLPLVVFGVGVVISMILQLVHCSAKRRGRESVIGRQSTLNLMATVDPNRRQSTVFRRKSEDEDFLPPAFAVAGGLLSSGAEEMRSLSSGVIAGASTSARMVSAAGASLSARAVAGVSLPLGISHAFEQDLSVLEEEQETEDHACEEDPLVLEEGPETGEAQGNNTASSKSPMTGTHDNEEDKIDVMQEYHRSGDEKLDEYFEENLKHADDNKTVSFSGV